MKITVTIEHLTPWNAEARSLVFALTKLLGALPRGVRWAIRVER